MAEQEELELIIKDWSHDHFIGFLLIHASHADYDYSKSEDDYIRSIIPQRIYAEVSNVFEITSEFQQLQIILKLKDQFIKKYKEKKKVIDLLNALFKKDGNFSRLESSLLNFLDRLL